MEWRFWRQKNAQAGTGGEKKPRLQGPKDLPQQIGQHLVTIEKMDPDSVWSLKCVVRRHADPKSVFDYRVFSPQQANNHGVVVHDYTTLDGHPELILFQGWLDNQTNKIKIEKGAPDLAA